MGETTEMDDCTLTIKAVKDTLDVLSGKWKFIILAALQEKKFRFKELAEFVDISPRMLSRELDVLEMNHLISRNVNPTKPVTVEYAMTAHGRTLNDVIIALRDWGVEHRHEIMKR